MISSSARLLCCLSVLFAAACSSNSPQESTSGATATPGAPQPAEATAAKRASSPGLTGSANGIAAVVNGQVITWSEVRDAVKAQEQVAAFQFRNDPGALQAEVAKVRANALDDLIDRQLILAEFKKIGGVIKPQYVEDDINGIIRDNFKGNRDEFVTELARTGMTMKKFREVRERMIIVNVMRGRYAAEQAPPTPREVDQYYQEHIADYRENDMIKISTISIPKFTGDPNLTIEGQRRLAQDIRSRVIAGADFASIAKAESQDSRSDDGGEWPWMDRKQMKKSIADAAFQVKDGGVSPVIDDETMFIIIYCDAKKLGTPVPLEKLRPQIERMINQQKSRSSLDNWLKGLRKRAVIRRFE
ncbi:MAG: SurA N-terminal domain-containing protein [Verrucomicrobiales bacterium]|nr:SurA N-terminal domain-containing protein [Verrucomicrobiales bacterium]MCP5558542.1 SurA N-terminal domain-containing protein [Verrucomicrobiaceae bacterium]